MVGEEDATDLHDEARATLRDGVVDLVRRQRSAGNGVDSSIDTSIDMVLDWIALGGSTPSAGRFWTLDPIDGTKGFLRGDQYAIALALIDAGSRSCSACSDARTCRTPTGPSERIFVAADGGVSRVTTAMAPIPCGRPSPLPASARPRRASASRSSPGTPTTTTRRRIAELLGIKVEPYRIDSQCKYAAVAARRRLDLPATADRADYREKIWDHAAGKLRGRAGRGSCHRHRRRRARLLARRYGSRATAGSSPPMAGSTTTSWTPCSGCWRAADFSSFCAIAL